MVPDAVFLEIALIITCRGHGLIFKFELPDRDPLLPSGMLDAEQEPLTVRQPAKGFDITGNGHHARGSARLLHHAGREIRGIPLPNAADVHPHPGPSQIHGARLPIDVNSGKVHERPRGIQFLPRRDAPSTTDVPRLNGRANGHVETSLRQPRRVQRMLQQLNRFRTGFDGPLPRRGVDP